MDIKILKYLERTMKRGSYIVKLTKLLRFTQHGLYFLFKKEIGNITYPPQKIDKVGFFDKQRLIHTAKKNAIFFKQKNLYKSGSFIEMKKDTISIVCIRNRLMIEKKYKGIQKANKFYNELICLLKLSSVDGVPRVYYADYKKSILYIEFIDGLTVSKKKKINQFEIKKDLYNDVLNRFRKVLYEIHEERVIMYDLRNDNMMIKDRECYFFDFGDSIYFGRFLMPVVNHLKRKELNKLESELRLSVKNIKNR